MNLRDEIAIALAKHMLHLDPEDLMIVDANTEEGVWEDSLQTLEETIRGAYTIADVFMRVREG